MRINKIYDRYNAELKTAVADLGKHQQVVDFTKRFLATHVEDLTISLDGFYICRSVITYLLKQKQFVLARKLCRQIDTIDLVAIKMPDSGERDFYVGVALVETGDREAGVRRLMAANAASRGRCFGLLPFGKDYRTLIPARTPRGR